MGQRKRSKGNSCNQRGSMFLHKIYGISHSSVLVLTFLQASVKALNNLYYFERFKDKTIYHYVEAKYEKTKVNSG